jgi:A/G-specific adenine glycosylase
LEWFDHCGRKDLPWQQDITPYRVWVSEIMLQQTQVKTVIPYFERFMDELPGVSELAAAEEDRVLHLWTGLGYYARARNLHKTAKLICDQNGGQFPETVEALCELPGIGRSTAGAVRSIAHRQRAPILDGNVKRVLARYGAIDGWPGKSDVLKELWKLAEVHTPNERPADYNQAMMDLGATVCLPRAPLCDSCPLSTSCQARQTGNPEAFPGKKPRKKLPVKTTTMLMISNPAGEVFLARRPPQGIWGGLWSFPELDEDQSGDDFCLDSFCLDKFNAAPEQSEAWETYRHTFSHYHLDIQPLKVTLAANPQAVMEGERQLWYNSASPEAIGLAAPVAKLLNELEKLR